MSRRSVLIESLAATPRDLQRMLRRVDDEHARWRPASDAWCIADIVAHLSYTEILYLARLRRVVAEDNPQVALITDPGEHDLARSLTLLFDEFAAHRAETVAFLSDLEQRDWGRSLVHETTGATRLRDQVQALVTHDNEHLGEIVSIREAIEASLSQKDKT